MKHSKSFFAAISVCFCVFFACAAAHADERPQFSSSSVIVVTKPADNNIHLFSTANTLSDIYNQIGISEVKKIASFPSAQARSDMSLFSLANGDKQVLKLTLSEAGRDNVTRAVDTLNASGAVSYAQPNYYYYLMDTVSPNDPIYLNNPTALQLVHAEELWEYDIDCSDVTIAIIDSGINVSHEDLAGNIWINEKETEDDGEDNDNNYCIDDIHGWNFDLNSNDITDTVGHGTHVAGIAGAVTNNGLGTASLARNAKLVALKSTRLNEENQTVVPTDLAISAIEYSNDMGFDIVNCSWGNNIYDQLLADAIYYCADTLFICAAGNRANEDADSTNNDDTPVFPASLSYTNDGYDNVISVASCNADDTLSDFSNYGENSVEIAAPGALIKSTFITSNSAYATSDGTSQSAPFVASAAAALKGKHPYLYPGEMKHYILSGADSVDTLTCRGENLGILHKIAENRRLNAAGIITEADKNGNKAFMPDIDVEDNGDGTFTVTLSTITDGASMFYTTDGSVPVQSAQDMYVDPFTVSADAKIRAMAVVIYDPDRTASSVAALDMTVETPTVSTPVISYENIPYGKKITITCETDGAEIYYTTSDAPNTPRKYTAPFDIGQSTKITAYATKQHMNDSETVSADIEVVIEKTAKPTIVIKDIPEGKEITLATVTAGATIYYSIDGNEPIEWGVKYHAPFAVYDTRTIKATAAKFGLRDSDMLTVDVTVQKLASPTFSIESGTALDVGTSVTLTSADSAAIYYTTDGSDPTGLDAEKIQYSEPIVITKDTVIKAYTAKDGCQNSDIVTAEYTVKTVIIPTPPPSQPPTAPPIDTTSISASIGSVTTDGGEFSVPVSISSSGEEAFSGFGLSIVYDNTKFNFKSLSAAEGLSQEDFICTDSDGVIGINCSARDIGGGNMFSLVFEVKKDTENGEYDISFTSAEDIVIDSLPEYETEVTNGKITVARVHSSTDILDTEVTLTDENENEIVSGSSPSQINASVSFINADSDISDEQVEKLESFSVIIVVYGENNELLALRCSKTSRSELSTGITQTINTDGSTIGKINMLIWDNFDFMLPLRSVKMLVK